VLQRLVVGDRVVSHLRFTGHFTGTFRGTSGNGQSVDFIATDILKISGGKITDNWHLEDNLTFLRQIGSVPGP
jgi:predicted ester cyclase